MLPALISDATGTVNEHQDRQRAGEVHNGSEQDGAAIWRTKTSNGEEASPGHDVLEHR